MSHPFERDLHLSDPKNPKESTVSRNVRFYVAKSSYPKIGWTDLLATKSNRKRKIEKKSSPIFRFFDQTVRPSERFENAMTS